jgi:hypothetical protein
MTLVLVLQCGMKMRKAARDLVLINCAPQLQPEGKWHCCGANPGVGKALPASACTMLWFFSIAM